MVEEAAGQTQGDHHRPGHHHLSPTRELCQPFTL